MPILPMWKLRLGEGKCLAQSYKAGQSYKVAQGWETLNELQGQAAATSKFSWKEEETTPLPQDNTLPPGLELGLPLSVASTGLRSR